ncbi:hypothetical protein AGMMS49975_25200 [Clostridia bacterium]|nr:hypothetical protein AGMMS49975_25200 [Clostridia bacterium]
MKIRETYSGEKEGDRRDRYAECRYLESDIKYAGAEAVTAITSSAMCMGLGYLLSFAGGKVFVLPFPPAAIGNKFFITLNY